MGRKLYHARAGGISTKYRSCDGLFLEIDELIEKRDGVVGRKVEAL
jgi:hypothetical protein